MELQGITLYKESETEMEHKHSFTVFQRWPVWNL